MIVRLTSHLCQARTAQDTAGSYANSNVKLFEIGQDTCQATLATGMVRGPATLALWQLAIKPP